MAGSYKESTFFFIFASCEGLIAFFMLKPNMAMKIWIAKNSKKFDDFDLLSLHVAKVPANTRWYRINNAADLTYSGSLFQRNYGFRFTLKTL